jgi:predicted Zn-dependent peptidase
MFGLRREVLEHRTPDPEEILEAISKVTAEDVNRVAQDVIGKQGVNLAVIGPFDDPARFEKLLA